MTTRPCPDCHKPTSPMASACPHCGRPLAVMSPQDIERHVAAVRSNRRAGWIIALILLGGCTVMVVSTGKSDGPRSESTGMTLAEAFCSDLRAGMNAAFIIPTDDGTTPERAAQMAYGYASDECPDELETNEGLRTWLRAWGLSA